MIQLTIQGQIPSGKNQQQLLFRNGKVVKYPNKRFVEWRKDAAMQIIRQRVPGNLTRPVALACTYFPGDRRVRDVSGMLDALFHLLVHSKILKDDGLIYDVTWTRMAVSKAPKVMLEIHERGIA